jgi:hypothetical protein
VPVETAVGMVREKLRGRLQGGAGGLQRAFKFFDRDGSGCVSRAEFTKTMQVNLGLNFEPRLMQQVFAAFDPHSSGEIDYPRFTAVVMESSGSALSAGTSLSTSTASLRISSNATGNSEMFLVRRAGRAPQGQIRSCTRLIRLRCPDMPPVPVTDSVVS